MQASLTSRFKNLSPSVFFIFWFVIGIIQAAGTGLMDDEAYYWVYSRFLDWGYYDHPPMTAILIKAGTMIFPGELGVRFFIVLLNTFTLAIIHSLLRGKNDALFYWIAFGMAVMQIGGILAVPDLPLIFFIACFFAGYKNFLENMSLKNTVLLAIAMAAMLYSKYHGVLIIIFTLLSNPLLLKRYQAWMAVFISLVFYVPHLVWQYQNGMPSVQYHLFERNAVDYRVSYTLEYLGGQLAFMGPFIGWLLLWAAFKQKSSDPFGRALKWSLFGTLIFFGISSMRGRVEANWTIPVFVPLIILAHQYLSTRPKWWPFLRVSAIITFAVVLVARLYLLADVEPLSWIKKDEFHKNKERAAAIKERAAGRPVVFINSYQGASKHWFYSGDTSLSLNTFYYRRNNYNFWPIERQFQQREALVLNVHLPSDSLYGEPLLTKRGNFSTYNDPCFSSRMADWIEVTKEDTSVLEANVLTQPATFTSSSIPFASCNTDDSLLGFVVYSKGAGVWQNLTDFVIPQNPNARVDVNIRMNLPEQQIPDMIIRFGLPTSVPGNYTLNSRR